MRSSEKLNQVGLKATGPRLKVLQVFQGSAHLHLTAEDVHRRLLSEHADAGLATVYRVLNQLTDVGILSRSVFDSGTALYELQREGHHDHLICLACGRVDEFSDEVIEERQRAVASKLGYALAQHQLALYGYCPACRSPK
jgi:Fur family ferric uptake transcriptional regulator